MIFPYFQNMEVSYALAPSGEPSPCKRVLTRALEDWDIVTAEAVLEGKGCPILEGVYESCGHCQ